jgi:endonuclease/exonuclease/phosphatase family metal-dependent hydrolase
MPDDVRRKLRTFFPKGLQRRAAKSGFAFAEILQTPSSYHLALLSTRPLRVLFSDVTNMERGMLAAESGGVVFVLVHLHAHSAERRRAEAVRVLAHVRDVERDMHLPVVVMGDMNTLSPLDAACHRRDGLLDFFASGEAALREKFLRTVRLPNGSDSLAIDYRPMGVLLSGDPEWDDIVAGSPPAAAPAAPFPALVDLLRRFADPDLDACLGTEPTDVSMIEHVDRPPSFRLDFMLASPRALRALAAEPSARCDIVRDAQTQVLSDHFPVQCGWDRPRGRTADTHHEDFLR